MVVIGADWGGWGATSPASFVEPDSAPTLINYQGIVKVDDETFAHTTRLCKPGGCERIPEQ